MGKSQNDELTANAGKPEEFDFNGRCPVCSEPLIEYKHDAHPNSTKLACPSGMQKSHFIILKSDFETAWDSFDKTNNVRGTKKMKAIVPQSVTHLMEYLLEHNLAEVKPEVNLTEIPKLGDEHGSKG